MGHWHKVITFRNVASYFFLLSPSCKSPKGGSKLTMNEGGITVNKMQNRKRQRGHRENSTPTTLNAPKVPKLNVSICVPIPPHFVQYSQSDSLLRPERLRKETIKQTAWNPFLIHIYMFRRWRRARR